MTKRRFCLLGSENEFTAANATRRAYTHIHDLDYSTAELFLWGPKSTASLGNQSSMLLFFHVDHCIRIKQLWSRTDTSALLLGRFKWAHIYILDASGTFCRSFLKTFFLMLITTQTFEDLMRLALALELGLQSPQNATQVSTERCTGEQTISKSEALRWEIKTSDLLQPPQPYTDSLWFSG